MAVCNDDGCLTLRYDSLENWNKINPTLSQGELVIVNDNGKYMLKAGNGSSNFKSLEFVGGSGSNSETLERNKAYSVGDIIYSINLPSYLYMECTTAGTTATSELNWDNVKSSLGKVISDGTAKFAVRDVRNHHNVGDIVIKDTTPKDSEYLLPMDGQSFDKTVYVLLAELYPSGVLPCLNDNRFLEGAETAGETKSAGLPNITGTVQGVKTWNLPQPSGAFALLSAYNGPNGATSGTGANYSFNASSSSDVYGASTTVQPKSYTVKYYVCYA